MRKLLTLMLGVAAAFVAVGQSLSIYDNPEYFRGKAALDAGDYDKAMELFNADLSVHPDNGYSYAGVARCHKGLGNYTQALAASKVALRQLKKVRDSQFKSELIDMCGDVYAQLQDTAKAIAQYELALAENSKDELAYERLATYSFKHGELEKAEGYLKQLVKINEYNAAAYVGLGRIENSRKNYGEAINKFDFAIKLDPHCDAYSWRAVSNIALKNYDKAVDDIIAGYNNTGEVDAELIEQLGEAGRESCERAAALFKAESIRHPADVAWNYAQGIALMQSQNYSEAITELQKCEGNEKYAKSTEYIAKCKAQLK